MEEEMELPYVLAAKSQGMSERSIIRNVVFRNSIIPIVARFSSLFPALISGSIIIENIFGIPGMGQLLFESFLARDLSVVYAITFISAVLTWLSWIVTDFLLTKVDPRISF
jgi:peptide/nickel transport system permease protein